MIKRIYLKHKLLSFNFDHGVQDKCYLVTPDIHKFIHKDEGIDLIKLEMSILNKNSSKYLFLERFLKNLEQYERI